jgi:hypothetical protein
MLRALLVSRLAQLAGRIHADLDGPSGQGRAVWELVVLVLLAALLFLVLSLLIGWSERKPWTRRSFDLASRRSWPRAHAHRGPRPPQPRSEADGR